MTINIEQLKTMLGLQEGFNEKVNLDWKNAGYNFTDAIWTEAAEAFDHTAWPWWKKAGASIDYGQIKMEVIDIWHFLMSELLTYEATPGTEYANVIKLASDDADSKFYKDYNLDIEAVRDSLRRLVQFATTPKSEIRIVLMLAQFIWTMRTLEMTWEEVYKLYIGKNTLNTFRQGNGYKKDTEIYKAKWAAEKGWEDNQYLTEILKDVNVDQDVERLQLEITNKLMSAFHKSSHSIKKVA